MVKELRQVPVDEADAMLASNRQGIILKMMRSGQLDNESGMALYESTTDLKVVARDREAFEKGSYGPDSPSGVLSTLFFKLARKG